MVKRLKPVKEPKATRLAEEMNALTSDIQRGTYKQYTKPPPDLMTPHGKFGNNRVFVAHFEQDNEDQPDEMDSNNTIIGYMYTRDDRTNRDDESTKHINTHYRVLRQDSNGHIFQGSFIRKNDHAIGFHCDCSTAAADIDKNLGVDELPESGAITDLVDRGLKFELNDFLDRFDFDV